MARRVKSSKEKSIEADIAMLGAERTRLVTEDKRDENYRATLADLEQRIAKMPKGWSR